MKTNSKKNRIKINNLREESMEKINHFIQSIPKELLHGVITLSLIIMVNIFLLNICSWGGCYEINMTNILRLNLFCNTCTDALYNLQKYQVQIYVFLGGYIFTKINCLISDQIK
tara:strand:- start:1641 stop:1982 length:342 start_codon:yes stop_codon:yes gene_type:complete